MTEIQNMLFLHQDLAYREFHRKLMPTIDPERIIGVRTPEVRCLAAELGKRPDIQEFLEQLPHTYYEENNLHIFLIEKIKDFDECLDAVEKMLPYIDNWATCDGLSPKAFKKNLPAVFERVKVWIASGETYTIRFGIEMLMKYYLDDNFQTIYADLVSQIRSEEYYVNMMIAWYFATALAKHYEEVLPYLEEKRLDIWTHNKTIQKAVESYRISDDQKKYLRSLRIKK